MKTMKELLLIVVMVVIAAGCKLPRANENDPFSEANAGDTTSPTVESVTPAANAVNVSPYDQLIITFSKSMDRATVESAFSLTDVSDVSGTYSWSDYDKSVSFTPASVLRFSQDYSAVISASAADLYGNILESVWTNSFQTRSTTGTLDLSFGSAGTGFVTGDGAAGGNLWDSGNEICIDDSGRILIAGSSSNGTNGDMVIWRYNSDGSLDTTFNNKGWVTHDNAAGGSGTDWAGDILVDSSGRILAAGASYNTSGNQDMVIWRYNSDGSLDTTFNSQGWVVSDNAAGGNGDDICLSLALDGSGKIIAVGYSYEGSYLDMVIWRYNSDGTADNTFDNPNNFIIWHNVVGDSWGESMLIDGFGRILIAGSQNNLSSMLDMMIWRYNSDGSLDTSFNSQGWVAYNNTDDNDDDNGYSVTLDSSNKIIVAGKSENLTDSDMVVWRYNSDGTVDTTFGSPNGYITWDNTAVSNSDDYAQAVEIDNKGRIVVAGSSSNGSNTDMTLWRYNSDGSFDTLLNSQGWLVHNNAAGGSGDDKGYGMTLDEKYRICITGTSVNSSGNDDMVIWRYE